MYLMCHVFRLFGWLAVITYVHMCCGYQCYYSFLGAVVTKSMLNKFQKVGNVSISLLQMPGNVALKSVKKISCYIMFCWLV